MILLPWIPKPSPLKTYSWFERTAREAGLALWYLVFHGAWFLCCVEGVVRLNMWVQDRWP